VYCSLGFEIADVEVDGVVGEGAGLLCPAPPVLAVGPCAARTPTHVALGASKLDTDNETEPMQECVMVAQVAGWCGRIDSAPG
jgi:hypothetical protein